MCVCVFVVFIYIVFDSFECLLLVNSLDKSLISFAAELNADHAPATQDLLSLHAVDLASHRLVRLVNLTLRDRHGHSLEQAKHDITHVLRATLLGHEVEQSPARLRFVDQADGLRQHLVVLIGGALHARVGVLEVEN